ncbi:hypothetical protein NIES4071_109570 (plasmid) [Calothrix sp. NIES-4071]|nr:hypothetical protein NIES4071_109570 [Calothrix sp. NIES-4071]BAZ65235.1 hypothetical protein NIES4105_109680 [Calothrix sp. NIES-4105]
MANKLLNFRCPEPLLEAIDRIGQEYYPADNDNGCDRSKTLIDILIAGVEALTNGEVVLQKPGTVKQDVRQPSEADIKAMVEAAVEEKLKEATVQKSVQTEVQNLSNIPTRNEFHDLKELINGYKLSLMREIQHRDKSISILAEQVAELTARLDAMPASVITKQELESARDKVLQTWKTAKAPEKKERIKQGIDKVINLVSPTEPSIDSTPNTNIKPQTETQLEVASVPDKQDNQQWEEVAKQFLNEVHWNG